MIRTGAGFRGEESLMFMARVAVFEEEATAFDGGGEPKVEVEGS